MERDNHRKEMIQPTYLKNISRWRWTTV